METNSKVSVSQIQTYMSCAKKWEYCYIENLTPRVERQYLSIGKLCHKGMQTAMQYKWQHEKDQFYRREGALQAAKNAMDVEFVVYMGSNSFLPSEVPDMEKMRDDAQKVFEQAFWEFNIDQYEVMTVGKDAQPALELHFLVKCPSTSGLHGYIDAILKDKDTGFIWCVDYKFRKSLSPDDEEAVNIQNTVYSRACQQLGVPITGTMTWQHLNTPAAEPQLLKNGGVSRAKIKTTWSAYRQFCLDNGIDPTPYREEMQEKLADIEWYRATYEYRNTETIKRMWEQCIVPAARAIYKARNPKTNNYRSLYPWNCKMCQYMTLCQAELRGYDADYIRNTEYTKRTERQQTD